MDVGFDSNRAKNGGGIYNINSGPALTNGSIRGNVADYGGGLYNYNASNPSLTNVVLSGNVANVQGGGTVQQHEPPEPDQQHGGREPVGQWRRRDVQHEQQQSCTAQQYLVEQYK